MSAVSHSAGPDAIAVYLLLLDQNGRRMLVRGASGKAPVFRVAPTFYPEVEELVLNVRAECGLEVSMLRCLEEGDANGGKPRLYSAVCVSDDDRPNSGFSWTELDQPIFDRDAEAALASIARMEIERLTLDSQFDKPVPWDTPTGWHKRARDWTEANLPPSQGGAPWRMTQIRSWSISSVWRLMSGDKRLYFKASPRYFGSEVAVTKEVAARFPDASPRLVAAQSESGWMIMEDLGDLTLAKADRLELWRDTMKTIAMVQRGYTDFNETLEQVGIERRTTQEIFETLASWAQASSRPALQLYESENDAALRRLEPSLERIEYMACQLEELGLPQTLEHGDLDSTNVFIRDGVPVLMDWSDASISHPFFTPLTPAQARRHPEIVDTYLHEWTDYAPLETLRIGFTMAKPLAALESAFHYHRNIVPYLPYPYPDYRTLERYIPALLEMAAVELDASCE